MADTGELRSTTRDAVVRPLARAAERPCSRPGCPAPAQATLTFRYATREAWIERLSADSAPQDYDLCVAHAARTRPPHGWELKDRRPREEQVVDQPGQPPSDLGGAQTVAVLAAALRRVPDPAPPDPTPPADDVSAPPPSPDPSAAPTTEAPAPLDRAPATSPASDDPEMDGTADPIGPAAAPVLDEPEPTREDVAAGDASPALAPDGSGPSHAGAAAGPGRERSPRPVLAARERQDSDDATRAPSKSDQVAFDW